MTTQRTYTEQIASMKDSVARRKAIAKEAGEEYEPLPWLTDFMDKGAFVSRHGDNKNVASYLELADEFGVNVLRCAVNDLHRQLKKANDCIFPRQLRFQANVVKNALAAEMDGSDFKKRFGIE